MKVSACLTSQHTDASYVSSCSEGKGRKSQLPAIRYISQYMYDNLHACRLEDSTTPDAAAPEAGPSTSEPDLPSAKSAFGVRAKPLKIIHKKKKAVPQDAGGGPSIPAVAAMGGGTPEGEAKAGDSPPGGLLGLGSYGSESD